MSRCRTQKVMSGLLRMVLLACVLNLMPMTVFGQKELLLKADSILASFQKVTTDTNYIVRPKNRLTIRLLSNFSGARFKLVERERGQENEVLDLRSDMKWTLTSSINYRGLNVALSVNPGHIFDWYHDLEFNINAYGNKMGADLIFQRADDVGGVQTLDNYKAEIPEDMLTTTTWDANFYYVFNHRKFSYPAAFTQTYIQKRSAGSFIAGASFESVAMDIGKKWRILEDEDYRVMDTKMLGVGVGYGYNFVPTSRWLVHLSALPTIIIWKDLSMDSDGYSSRGSHPLSLPNMLITGRISIVHYFDNQFAGLMAVVNHSHLGQSGSDMVDHFKWRVRLFYGIRF